MDSFYYNNCSPNIFCYADAGYFFDPHEARSQTGYVLYVGGTTISWISTWIFFCRSYQMGVFSLPCFLGKHSKELLVPMLNLIRLSTLRQMDKQKGPFRH